MTVLFMASIVLQVLGPQVARAFIDAAQAGASEEILTRTALVFIIVTALQRAMNAVATYSSARVAWTAMNALRVDLTTHLLHLDLDFFKSRTPGELIERVDGDVNELADFFSSFVVKLIGNFLLLIGVLIAVSLTDMRFGLALTVIALMALVLISWVRKYATPYLKRDRQHAALFYGYIGEVLTATEDIRSSGAVPYTMRRFFELLQRWMPVRWRARVWGDAVLMTAVIVFAAADAVAYGLGGSLYGIGAISLGKVYMLVSYSAMLAEPIEIIRTQIQNLQRAEAAVARISELLGTTSKLKSGKDSLPSGPLAIEFRGVSFEYDDGHLGRISDDQQKERAIVIDQLSFMLESGHVLGLLGRTGSGKTTIARLIFRLYDPRLGEVRVGGVNLRNANLKILRSRIAFVTQDVQLFNASLRDNISFFDPECCDEQLLTVLKTLGLKSWIEHLPNGLDTVISGASLSAGEAQLVVLARAFLKDPGLVILDEASSRLDPATETLVERALAKLLDGRTVIIIAHRLVPVGRANEIYIIENGRILEHGTPEQLASDPHSRFAGLRRTGLRGEID